MLTGDEEPTDGEAILNGYRLDNNKQNFLQEIGYCPQFDAIIDHMTGSEMLIMFARLRGIPEQDVVSEANKWIDFLGINKIEGIAYIEYSTNRFMLNLI